MVGFAPTSSGLNTLMVLWFFLQKTLAMSAALTAELHLWIKIKKAQAAGFAPATHRLTINSAVVSFTKNTFPIALLTELRLYNKIVGMVGFEPTTCVPLIF